MYGQNAAGKGLMAVLILMIVMFVCSAVADGENIYVENEYNYVDESMDISGGIPENVKGGLERIRTAGVLRVATEPYYAPQEFIDPSLTGQAQYVGSDMELAKLIAVRMGVELEVVPMDFTEVLYAVAEGECDLAISGLAFTPARASQVELSKGYYFSQETTGGCIVIRTEDAETIMALEDLAVRKIVAQSGSLQEALAAERITDYEEFRRLSTITEVYQALLDGRADAAVVDFENVDGYIANNPDCGLMVVPGISLSLDKLFMGDRIAGKKGDLPLMYFINL